MNYSEMKTIVLRNRLFVIIVIVIGTVSMGHIWGKGINLYEIIDDDDDVERRLLRVYFSKWLKGKISTANKLFLCSVYAMWKTIKDFSFNQRKLHSIY